MPAVNDTTDAEAVPRRRLDSRARTVRGKTLVAGPQDAIELDEIATFIWKQIDGVRSVRHIADAVAAEWEVPAQTALEDVAELISDLVDFQVVELASPGR